MVAAVAGRIMPCVRRVWTFPKVDGRAYVHKYIRSTSIYPFVIPCATVMWFFFIFLPESLGFIAFLNSHANLFSLAFHRRIGDKLCFLALDKTKQHRLYILLELRHSYMFRYAHPITWLKPRVHTTTYHVFTILYSQLFFIRTANVFLIHYSHPWGIYIRYRYHFTITASIILNQYPHVQ